MDCMQEALTPKGTLFERGMNLLNCASRSPRWQGLMFAGASAVAGVVGAYATQRGKGAWYRSLRKPKWNPPDAAFGPVWTTLYGLASWSAYRVWQTPATPERTRALRLWWAQSAFNCLWSPLFFGAHQKIAAFADSILMTGSIAAYLRCARVVDKKAAWLMAPSLAWTTFATGLQAAILGMNRGR